jgi:squalene-hopene/tetraprenyl-beta-curcumene cyclase
MLERFSLLIVPLAFLSSCTARGDDQAKPGPNSDKEPMAEKFSRERGARFRDTVSVNWTRNRKCGTCHSASQAASGRRLEPDLARSF